MPQEKKHQHIVPACYLRGFISKEIPKGHRNNQNFKPGVLISDKLLTSGWKMRHPRHKIFTKKHFYTLAGDLPQAPVIEEFLSQIESNYISIRQRIESGNTLTFEDLHYLAAFTESLLARTEAFQNNFELSTSKLLNFVRLYHGERQYLNDEDPMARDISRKLILNSDLGKIVLDQGLHLLHNQAEMPFITSDSPVIHSILHVDQIAQLTRRPDLIDSSFTRNKRLPNFILPLTPRLAIFASRFFRRDYPHYPNVLITNTEAVFQQNLLVLNNAKAVVISAYRNPFGEFEEKLRNILIKPTPADVGPILWIYTTQNRYRLQLTSWEPIVDGLRFATKDLDILNQIINDYYLEEVTLQDQHQTRHLKNIEFKNPDATGQHVEICSQIRLGLL